MKIIITICLVFSVIFGQTQDNNIQEKTSKHNDSIKNVAKSISGISFLYDYKYYYKNLQTQFYNSNINNYINTISIGYIGEVRTSFRYDYQAYFFYNYYLPQSIIVEDSINQKLSGYDIRVSIAGQNIIKINHFHLFLTEGLSFGRIKLINEKNEKIKNQLFAPYIGIVSGVTFSKFSIIVIGQFDFDISSKKWKNMHYANSQDIILPNINQSGLNISLGFNLKI